MSSNPTSSLLALGLNDGSLSLFDSKSGKTVKMIQGHDTGLSFVTFGSDGLHLFTGDFGGTLRVWDVRAGGGYKCVGEKRDVHSRKFDEALTCGRIRKEGNFVATGGADS